MRVTSRQLWTRGRRRGSFAGRGGRDAPSASYQALLHYLAERGPTRLEALARNVGASPRRAQARLVALWDYGFVSVVHGFGGRDVWRLTDEGHRLVRALREEAHLTGLSRPDARRA